MDQVIEWLLIIFLVIILWTPLVDFIEFVVIPYIKGKL